MRRRDIYNTVCAVLCVLCTVANTKRLFLPPLPPFFLLHPPSSLLPPPSFLQLPPTVLSEVAEEAGLGVSLFSRLVALGVPPMLLDTQYRMHPKIAGGGNI